MKQTLRAEFERLVWLGVVRRWYGKISTENVYVMSLYLVHSEGL